MLLLIWINQSIDSIAQIREIDLYQTAYDYLNDSIVKLKYEDINEFSKNCKECCVKGIDLKFDPNLQVASRFIENNYGFPLKDLVGKKYNFSSDCLRAIRMGTRDCASANRVQDSLEVFWSKYKMKNRNKISQSLKGLVSDKKDGYQVFFSDIYKNTLAAELKEFCSPYDQSMWMGSSTSFYFVFNDKGEIKEVFSGVSIIYN